MLDKNFKTLEVGDKVKIVTHLTRDKLVYATIINIRAHDLFIKVIESDCAVWKVGYSYGPSPIYVALVDKDVKPIIAEDVKPIIAENVKINNVFNYNFGC